METRGQIPGVQAPIFLLDITSLTCNHACNPPPWFPRRIHSAEGRAGVGGVAGETPSLAGQ